MQSLARIFPRGRRRKAAAQARLVDSYKRVFSGVGSSEDADVVLVDLTQHSGYFHVTTPRDGDSNEIWYREGQRSVMARIMRFVDLPTETRDALLQAVALEDAASQEEETQL